MPAAPNAFSEYRASWRATGPAGRRFLAGGLVYLISAIGFSVAFPLYCKARGENATEIGLLVALAAIALFVFGVPITILGGRGHSRRLLPVGPIVAAVGLLLVVYSPDNSAWLLRLGALLAGANGATFWVLGDPLLAATTPTADRARVFALKFFLVTIGASIGGGLGGWIPGLLQGAGGFDRRAAFAGTLIVLALLNVAQSLIFLSIPPYQQPHPHRRQRDEPGSAVNRGPNRLAWVVMLALAAPELGMSIGHNTIRPFLSLFFTDRYNVPSATTGTYLAIMALAAGIGSLTTPRIAAKMGNIRAIIVLRVVAAGMILLWFSGLGLPAVLSCMIVYYALMDGTEAIFITEAMLRLPPNRWTVFSGIYAMTWSIASSGGSLLSGVLQDRHGGAFGAAFVLGVGGYAFSVCWMLGVFGRLPDIAGPPSHSVAFTPDPAIVAISEIQER